MQVHNTLLDASSHELLLELYFFLKGYLYPLVLMVMYLLLDQIHIIFYLFLKASCYW